MQWGDDGENVVAELGDDRAVALMKAPSQLLPAVAPQAASGPLVGRVALIIGRRLAAPIGIALKELGARAQLATSEPAALDIASSSAPPVVLLERLEDELRTVRMGKAVVDRSPSSKLVLVDDGDDLHAATAAARAGFHGYIAGDASPGRVMVAIRAALEDQFVVPRRLAQITFEASLAEQERARALAKELSEREWDVLTLLTEGESNREIGARLGISPHTVRAHIGKILAKLEARDRLEAATFAMRHKLVQKPNGRSGNGHVSLE